jgi:hypothetical protein
MDLSGLKSIAAKLAEVGLPAIAGAVAGPGGALAVKGLLSAIGLGSDATPEQAMAALGTLSGDQLVKMKELDTQLAQTQLTTAAAQVEAVNKTLQTEAMGGSWLQKNHHAMESMFVCGMVAALYVGLPLLKITVPSVDPTVWLMLGGILGVTAWQRGAANVATARAGS